MNIWVVIIGTTILTAACAFWLVRRVLVSSAISSIGTAILFGSAMAISGEKFAVIGVLTVLVAAVPVSLLVSYVCAAVVGYRDRRGSGEFGSRNG